MNDRLTTAVSRLADAFEDYDEKKAAHAEATGALKEARGLVEACARAVVEAQNPSAPSLFDAPDTVTVATVVDGADAEVVLSGTSGAPIADAPVAESPRAETPTTYALRPSDDDPTPGHGVRHHLEPAPAKPRKIGRRAKA